MAISHEIWPLMMDLDIGHRPCRSRCYGQRTILIMAMAWDTRLRARLCMIQHTSLCKIGMRMIRHAHAPSCDVFCTISSLVSRIKCTHVDVLAGMVTLAWVSAILPLSVTVVSCGKVVPSFKKAAFDEKTVQGAGGFSSSTRGGCAECPVGLRSCRITS